MSLEMLRAMPMAALILPWLGPPAQVFGAGHHMIAVVVVGNCAG
jgi:hypothetical protein